MHAASSPDAGSSRREPVRVDLGERDRRFQFRGVGMFGCREERTRRAVLQDRSTPHDDNPITEPADDGQVVADEGDRQPELAAQLFEQ